MEEPYSTHHNSQNIDLREFLVEPSPTYYIMHLSQEKKLFKAKNYEQISVIVTSIAGNFGFSKTYLTDHLYTQKGVYIDLYPSSEEENMIVITLDGNWAHHCVSLMS
ncbi:MAG: hypothetical protein BRC36_14090 [Cyanobacteria bacterium QH_2_48_84]|nr:MAG: hypothetical protein BRC36_14090 [Cyanobacteria bacterium QH_2_48_84]